MKYVLRKLVEANNAAEALKLDVTTPVHDIYLKEGEYPSASERTNTVGFIADIEK